MIFFSPIPLALCSLHSALHMTTIPPKLHDHLHGTTTTTTERDRCTTPTFLPIHLPLQYPP
ncbi:hypothetical protein GLYMA_05G121150v4 [Glycine max]|nr:hypothetical protein GLYMA_05G121150v4 [Glycine max]KAH1133989.1 hypothetical protein GYH30_012408 [Glycine max]